MNPKSRRYRLPWVAAASLFPRGHSPVRPCGRLLPALLAIISQAIIVLPITVSTELNA